MLKISDTIRNICSQQPLLAFGIYNRIFNLSALAKLLRPMIEARTKKEVKDSAILMSLSRYQKSAVKYGEIPTPPIINTNIHSNLCSISFYSNQELFNNINIINQKVREARGYISIIQGVYETNVIIDEICFHLVDKHVKDKPKNIRRNIASLNIQIAEHAYETPGQFYCLVQAISLQGINIFEITSAFSEMIFYLDQKDVKLAFDTIYNYFQSNKKTSAETFLKK